jgi:predicted LPLAT superfamily acyltransferase
MSHWSSIKEKTSGYWQMKFLLVVYKLLGKRVFKLCLYPVVTVFFLVSKQTREFSSNYLNRIKKINSENLPNVGLRGVFKHIFSFADGLSDKIIAWSGNVTLDNLNVKTPEAYEEFLNTLQKKQGVFLIGSHFGNIEIFRALASFSQDKRLAHKININTIMQIEHTAHFNKLLRQLNPDVGLNLVSAMDIGMDTMIELKDRLSSGEIVITAGDRTGARNPDKSVVVEFLGEAAHFPLGSFTLASLMESPIYFVFLLKEKNESYSLYMYKSGIDFIGSRKERRVRIEAMVGEYVSHFEPLVLKYPYQWYNFFDFWGR